MNKKFIWVLVALCTITLHVKGQDTATAFHKWQFGLTGYALNTFESSYFTINPQLTYYYSKNRKRGITIGMINDISRHSEGIRPHQSGFTKGVYTGHKWNISYNKKLKTFWWLNFNVMYVEGDIAYKHDPVRAEIVYYAPKALMEVAEIMFEKKWGKHFYLDASGSLGNLNAFGPNIRGRQPVFGLKIGIGYGF